MLTSFIQSSSPSTTTRPSTRTAPNLRRSTCVTKNIQETCLQADELTYPCSARTPCSPLSSRLSSVLPTSSPSSRYASISRSRKGLYVIALAGQEWLIRNVTTGASLPAHRAPGCYRRRAAQQREWWYPRRCQRRTSGMTHLQPLYEESITTDATTPRSRRSAGP